MNRLNLELLKVFEGEHIIFDGIRFENAMFVELSIDGVPLRKLRGMEDCLVVFSEVEKTLRSSGKYLIFTSASGIADDGGWDGVNVSHSNKIINWSFKADSLTYSFDFIMENYTSSILELLSEVNSLEDSFDLEPESVFFPEEW